MQIKTDIQTKAEDALSSIDNLQRATPRPFFYTRLMAKIDSRQQSVWEKFGSFISRPAIAFVTLSLILLINLFAAYSNLNATPATEQPELTTTEEYTQVANNFYDFENVKP